MSLLHNLLTSNLHCIFQTDLAKSITREQGKTLADAEGDVLRGLQVVEQACSLPTMLMGDIQPNVAQDMETYSFRLPLGVCAGICP